MLRLLLRCRLLCVLLRLRLLRRLLRRLLLRLLLLRSRFAEGIHELLRKTAQRVQHFRLESFEPLRELPVVIGRVNDHGSARRLRLLNLRLLLRLLFWLYGRRLLRLRHDYSLSWIRKNPRQR